MRVVFTLLVAMMLVARSAAAGPPLDLVADERWHPFIKPESDRGGLVVRLIEASFAEVDQTAETHFMPWSRLLREARTGRFDGVAGAFYGNERALAFHFSDPIMDFRVGFFARAGFSPRDYETLEELKGLTVGVIRDAVYPAALYQADLQLVEQHSREALIRMLARGRIDLLADTEALFRHHALVAGFNPDDFLLLSPPLQTQPLYLMAPRSLDDSPAVIEAFNRGLETLRNNGMYLAIRREYGF